MKGEHYLTRNVDFQRVYDGGKAWAGREVVVRALPNELGLTRYGFAVGRRVGNAVIRNKVKRRLREILRQQTLRTGWDIILIARASAVPADYKSLEKSVANLLIKAGLSLGEHEGVGSGVN